VTGELRTLGPHPCLEGGDKRRAALAAHRETVPGGLAVDLAFDIEPLVSPGSEIELVGGVTIMAGLVLVRSMIVRRRLDAAEPRTQPERHSDAANSATQSE